MNHRIEISPLPQLSDARAASVAAQIGRFLGIDAPKVISRDVYTMDAALTVEEADKIAGLHYNPVTQMWRTGNKVSENYQAPEAADFILVVGFRPGVTDNVARTFKVAAEDILGRKLAKDDFMASSVEYLVYSKNVTAAQLKELAYKLLANELIQTAVVLDKQQLAAGIPLNLPRVNGEIEVKVETCNLEVSDEELMKLSRERVLVLSLEEMKSIQNYFRHAKNREKAGLTSTPTDVEMEVLAQTWSEHCKHKIFSAMIDYFDAETGERKEINSCYKTFIQKSTKEIAEKVDFLVSVFKDNSGVITFNDKYDIAYKVETHNSPSALDPYGGAMTGIVGVNRDPMGTGQAAELLINVWGYCLGSPFTDEKLVPEGLLHPRRLRDGVHKGVIDGGNQSGIPYGNGWEYFDDRYIGKPLVYCGTVGRLPRTINGVPGYTKSIKPGDLVVMGGGRIGKDGIHGATFSSEELNRNSPVQAVQIGDPITQKKLSDFIMEARDRGLYRFITDNGAGGLSSSVGEMAEECGGCRIDLAKAPLKYAGMQPWEILISEAQERMSFAVPPEKIDEFTALAKRREVEISVLGVFTDDGIFHVDYNGKTVCHLEMEFMHSGLPKMHLKATWKKPHFEEPCLDGRNPGKDVAALIGRLNICSDEYKARQYDHEVKGQSVIKPFGGVKRDVAGDASITMIEPLSTEGIVLTSAILPRYSDIDTYQMTAGCIDLAVRRAIAVGANMKHLAILDNFCWPDPVQSEKTPDGEYKLAQLVRANQALYDFTKKYLVPCISGKDSMKNDSTKGGRKISIPPSLLFSLIGKMDDIRIAVTPEVKKAGDVIYVIGNTLAELGGSEYFNMLGYTGNAVPQVDADTALATYDKVAELTQKGLVRSLITPALGGLAIACAKAAMGGRLGIKLDLSKLPVKGSVNGLERLFSESHSRFVASVAPEKTAAFEAVLQGVPFAKAGTVTAEAVLEFTGCGADCKVTVEELVKNYKATLAGI